MSTTSRQYAWALALALVAGCGSEPAAAPDPAPVAAPAPREPQPAELVPPPPPDEAAGPFEATPPDAFVRCIEVEGVVEIKDEAGLAGLVRNDGPGCATRPPPAVDWAAQKLVLYGTMASCEGAVEANDAAFHWSQWGDCERAESLRAQRVLPKEAPTPRVSPVAWHANEAARVARFQSFAALVQRGDVAAVRALVGDEGVQFVESSLGDGEPRIVERTRETLTAADLKGTQLARRKLRNFRCHARGDEVLCVASGENYMNGYHLQPSGDRFTIRTFREAEH